MKLLPRAIVPVVVGAIALTAAALIADSGANHQKRTTAFGSSGGNTNDRTNAFCCGGTLGALVTDSSGVDYVLSNNHVLARTDAAAAGEDITQPGLIDNGCRPATIVADFLTAAPLGSNIDAALATLRSGQMDASGSILDIGQISSVVREPSVGLDVAKSGRTTGFTTGTIGSINTNVNVQYQKNCGSGKKFIVSYTNQVLINSSTFSAGGDSGSLIVTNDSDHQPVALLYAGSSSTTIGNPAGEVLSKLSGRLGNSVSFVGQPLGTATGPSTLSAAEIAAATAAKDANTPGLMQSPAVQAVGVGLDPDNPGRAAVLVYLVAGEAAPRIPAQINGVHAHVLVTDRIRAYGWNAPAGVVCKGQ
jgi:hypothetical protein